MTYIYHDDRENTESSAGLDRLLEELKEGDCMVVERFSGAAKSTSGFLSLMQELESRGIRFRSMEENFDTGTEQGRFAAEILKKVAQLDGEPRREKQREDSSAKEESKFKGRKPIEVDEDIFDTILERWKNGEITARQAMNELGLKPNTFYRRVKERMTETKGGEAIFNAAKQLGKEVAAGAEELTQAAGKLASEYDANAVMETIGKNISAAGKVLNKHIEGLSRDFQEAMDKYNQSQKPEDAQSRHTGDAPADDDAADIVDAAECDVPEESQEGKEWI